jgi:hypothetical protein
LPEVSQGNEQVVFGRNLKDGLSVVGVWHAGIKKPLRLPRRGLKSF